MAIPNTPETFVISLLSIRTYPLSPQLGAKLFLTIKYIYKTIHFFIYIYGVDS